MQIRPLTTLDECRQVAALEKTVWGYTDAEDVVPPPVLIVSIKRGGILLGAFDDGGTMRGFVYSMPAIKAGRPTQWSHMLGVSPEMRAAGLGARLKLAQRQAALDMGIDLDRVDLRSPAGGQRPPQLRQARRRRRGVRREHLRGIEQPAAQRHADRSLRGRVAPPRAARRAPDRGDRWLRPCATAAVSGAPVVNPSLPGEPWLRPGPADLSLDERRLLVEDPGRLLGDAGPDPGLAHEWRMSTREIFQTYFARGYRAVDFFLAREAGRGQYLLIRRVECQVLGARCLALGTLSTRAP